MKSCPKSLAIMDSVLKGAVLEIEDNTERLENEILRCYPHLATKEADEGEI